EDPDAVAIDGTQSPAVAGLAVRAAVEGRKVLLAIEAADGRGAVARLAGLNQRLLLKVCTICREDYTEEPASLEDLRLESLLGGVPLKRGRGCDACGRTGYKG